MTEKKRQAMIAEVMEYFDFEQVHDVIVKLNWVWVSNKKKDCEVPSVYRMMKASECMLNDVSQYDDDERHEQATGGLRAVKDEEGNLELRFELETSVSYDEDFNDEGECKYKDD